MKDLLDSMGYNVEIANEYDAITRVKYSYPEIVIVNLIMKETTGDKIIKKIKVLNDEIICILCSNSPISMKDYKNNRIDGVMQTPASKDRLQEAISLGLKSNTKVFNERIKEDELIERLMKKIDDSSKFTFCPYCGNKLDEDKSFRFCYSCGHKLQ